MDSCILAPVTVTCIFLERVSASSCAEGRFKSEIQGRIKYFQGRGGVSAILPVTVKVEPSRLCFPCPSKALSKIRYRCHIKDSGRTRKITRQVIGSNLVGIISREIGASTRSSRHKMQITSRLPLSHISADSTSTVCQWQRQCYQGYGLRELLRSKFS